MTAGTIPTIQHVSLNPQCKPCSFGIPLKNSLQQIIAGVIIILKMSSYHLRDGVKEGFAWTSAPAAPHGGLCVCWHRPVAGESPEVINAALVVHVEGAPQALRPPPEAVLLVRLRRTQRSE